MEARCVLRHANCLRSQRLLTILLRGRDERQPRGRDGAQSLYRVQLSVLTALNPQHDLKHFIELAHWNLQVSD